MERHNDDRTRLTRREALGALAAIGVSASRAWSGQAFPGRVGQVQPRPKFSIFLARAASVDREAFVGRWIEQETTRVLKTPGLTALTVNAVDHGRTADSPYDAVAELEFGNAASLDAYRAQWSPAATSLAKKDPFTMVTWQVVIRPLAPGGRSGAKRIGIVGHPATMTRDEFLRDWRDVHAPDVDHPKGLTGYILNYSDLERSPSSPWDGYAELWWPDWQVQATYQAERRAMNPPPGFFRSGPHLLVQERFQKELTPAATA